MIGKLIHIHHFDENINGFTWGSQGKKTHVRKQGVAQVQLFERTNILQRHIMKFIQ